MIDAGSPVDAGSTQDPRRYDIGTPRATALWVSPTGSDANDGASRSRPLATLSEAWRRATDFSSSGYRILLTPGRYPCEPGPGNCLNDFADRHASYAHPLIVQAADGPRTVTLEGGLNLRNVHYLYLIDVDLAGGGPLPTNAAGNNLLHLEGGRNVLIRNVRAMGPNCGRDDCNNLQEVFKVNQSEYLFVEDSYFRGAWHSAVDWFAVQHATLYRNEIEVAGQWCMYVKGGSAHLRIEANELHHCQLGFSAGQGSNLNSMRSPYFHYDVYDVKFVNNVLHHLPGVGMAASGGYNVLFAFNTLYRIANDPLGYALFQAVFGGRGCTPVDEAPNAGARCSAMVAAGAWGARSAGDWGEWVPNRNVFVYNNVFYNPAGVSTEYTHFHVRESMPRPRSLENAPSPVRADDNLVLAGNVVFNGSSLMGLGLGDDGEGCRDASSTCSPTRVRALNSINQFEPDLVDPARGDYRPRPNGRILGVRAVPVPDFSWSDAPVRPAVPAGELSNQVPLTRDGQSRSAEAHPGAY